MFILNNAFKNTTLSKFLILTQGGVFARVNYHLGFKQELDYYFFIV
jgi:hypothetical protein